MSGNRHRSRGQAGPSFVRNLAAGNYGPLERMRTIAATLARRGGPPPTACCGHYGDPGC
jgi:hypothetical protein